MTTELTKSLHNPIIEMHKNEINWHFSTLLGFTMKILQPRKKQTIFIEH